MNSTDMMTIERHARTLRAQAIRKGIRRMIAALRSTAPRSGAANTARTARTA